MKSFNKSTDLEKTLRESGVSRRDFLKYCGTIAVTLGSFAAAFLAAPR